jgi:quercetin dioxygenase-like cupin family protein
MVQEWRHEVSTCVGVHRRDQRRVNEERMAMSNVKFIGMSLALLAFSAQPIQSAHAEDSAAVTPLISKDLADMPGKELLMITVDYPPGYVGAVHRHDAHSFVFVLEGSVVMGVRGGKEVTLTQGQTFYEGPNDVHTVGRNASVTKPAKLVVVLLKKKGADVVLPAE